MSSKTKLVLRPLARNRKHTVRGISSFACSVFQINPKFVSYSSCQAVYLVQSEPKLAIQVTEAILVVSPATVEIDRAVQSFLEHCPPPLFVCSQDMGKRDMGKKDMGKRDMGTRMS